MKRLWDAIPAGVRVFYITDTCNSGTNYRKPKITKTIPKNYKGALIHYGGCADSLYSYGSGQGGVFTTAMIDAFNKNLTYKEWFEKTLKKMPQNQKPVYAEYGNVKDSFRNAKVFK